MNDGPAEADGSGRAHHQKAQYNRQSGVEGEEGWLLAMGVAAAIEFGWWAICWSAGRVPLPFLGTYVAIVASALALIILFRRLVARRRPQATPLSIALGSLLFAVGASLFLPLKFGIPEIVPFWLDVPLADFERTLFGGQDPWRIFHAGLGWAVLPMDRVYGLWLPVQTFAALALMLEPPSIVKSRALTAFALGWLILGVGAALLLSSAGPLFFDRLYGGARFADLRSALDVKGAWMTLGESDAMWRSFASDRPTFVAGISAAPSLHVAISFWMYLAARTNAPALAPWALAYMIFIWIASVVLGWHYIADGLLGICGMWVIWAASRWLLPTAKM